MNKYICTSAVLEYNFKVLVIRIISISAPHFRGKYCTFYSAVVPFQIKILHEK